MRLIVDFDGRLVPLGECVWVERMPCGCLASWVLAVGTNQILATAEQAAAHIQATRGDDTGRMELIPTDDYPTRVGGQWKCSEHAAAEVAR